MMRRLFSALAFLLLAACGSEGGAPQQADAGALLPMLVVEDTAASPPAPAGPSASPAVVGQWPSPQAACSFLNDRGLPTDGYALFYDDEWGCTGSFLITEEAPGPPNEVTYMVSGNRSQVTEIEVIAENFINSPGAENFTRARATIAAQYISEQILGKDAPAEALEAFQRSDEKRTWTVNGIQVAVEREDFPTGRGYHMHYRLRPVPGGGK